MFQNQAIHNKVSKIQQSGLAGNRVKVRNPNTSKVMVWGEYRSFHIKFEDLI
jgi:hypothetical protein